MMDIHEILKKLPHRYPFLLVDRVLEVEPGKRIQALKNVTINEPFFVGHFPHRPVMPGVLMLEAMAQTAGLLAFAGDTATRDAQLGDLLRRHRRRALQAAGRAGRPAGDGRRACCATRPASTSSRRVARVGEGIACEAELMCTMRTIA